MTIGTVRRWTAAGLLPVERTAGGHRRYRVADVDAAFQARFVEADDEGRVALLDRLARRVDDAAASGGSRLLDHQG